VREHIHGHLHGRRGEGMRMLLGMAGTTRTHALVDALLRMSEEHKRPRSSKDCLRR